MLKCVFCDEPAVWLIASKELTFTLGEFTRPILYATCDEHTLCLSYEEAIDGIWISELGR